MNKTPNVIIRFDPSECRHATQPNPVLYDPEQFPVGVALHGRGSEVRSPGIHPASRIGWGACAHPVAHSTFGSIKLVTLSHIFRRIRRFAGNAHPALPRNQEMLSFGSQVSLCPARFVHRSKAETTSQNNGRHSQNNQEKDRRYFCPLHFVAGCSRKGPISTAPATCHVE